MKRSILITGATGYLATPLALYLQKSLGNQVEITLGARSIEKLESLPSLKIFKKVHFDISDEQTFEESLHGIDTVIHLAAMGARASEKNPELAHFINVDQVKVFIEKAVEKKISSFIYFSTVHVYGAPLKGELSETLDTFPVSVYGKTHLLAENILLSFIKKNKIDGIILRLANMVGAPVLLNEEIEALIANHVCIEAVTKNKITLSSSGQALRDFATIDKLGCFLSSWLFKVEKENHYPVYNIGSGKTLQILDFVKIVQQRCKYLYGYYPELEALPPSDKGDPIFFLDVSKATSLLTGYEDKLIETIDDTLIFFKKNKARD